jgi:hypothetical protein
MTAALRPPEEPPVGQNWSVPARIGFESLINQGPVMVAVNASFPDVAPDHVRAFGPAVVLRFGYGLTPTIHDLAWNDVQLTGTLMFGGQPFTCQVPWSAILAIKLDGVQMPTKPACRPRGGHLKLVP